MNGFEMARCTMRKLFPGSWNQPSPAGAVSAKMDVAVVRLIESPHRLPATPIERQLVATLQQAGPVSLAKLVKTVAGEVYAEELRKGSGVLDIGLFGSRLFNSDVVRELRTGDGILWEIKSERKGL